MLRHDSTAAAVEEHWAMPNDLSEAVSRKGPNLAFKVFFEYAEMALSDHYLDDIDRAILGDAATAGEIPRINGWQPWPSVEQRKHYDAEIGRGLRLRIAPLLPIIRIYARDHSGDPSLAARIGWMQDQIEALPGAVDGQRCHPLDGTDEMICLPRNIEPGLWKELRDGLLEIADSIAPGNVSIADGPVVETSRLQWLKGADVFGYLLRRLADKGYIAAPMKTRKGAEEVHAKEFAEELARHWQIGPRNGQPAKLNTLTTALSRGASIHSDTVDQLIEDLREE